mgnify:FL=1
MLPLIWAGCLVGAGFIAVPAVFAGPEAGRLFAYAAAARVFERLALGEQAAALLLLLPLLALGLPRWRSMLFGALAVALILQAVWLRPELLERTAILTAGGAVAPSPAHAVNSVLELAKLGSLGWIAWASRKGPSQS